MTVWFDDARQKWRFDFQLNKHRRSGYCVHPDSKKDARNKREAQTIQELWRERYRAEDANEKKAEATDGFSLAMAMSEYLTRANQENKSAFNNQDYTVKIISHFGAGRLLADIDLDDILRFRAALAAEKLKVYVGGPEKGGEFKESDRTRSQSTVNKYLVALEAAWRAAQRRHRPKIPDFPACPEMPFFATEEHLPNPVSQVDVARLLDIAPIHLRVTILLAVHTSMRQEEILALTWPEVRLDMGIIMLPSRRTKAAKARIVQLTKTAHELLSWLYENRPADQDRVVLYWHRGYGEGEPKPISGIRTAWRNALRDAGIAGHYRFHDLRGVMGTYLADKVAPLPLQRWLGHANIKTTMRYIELGDATQRATADLAEGYTATKTAMDGIRSLTEPTVSNVEEAKKYVGVYPAGRYRYQSTFILIEEVDGVKTKKARYLGSFDTALEAARAYDEVAKNYPGRRLNFPNVAQLPTKKPHTASPTQDLARKEGAA